MPKTTQSAAEVGWKLFPIALAVLVAVFFSWSVRPTQQHFDYTFRIADAFLHGHLGLNAQPPSWLNEMVLVREKYYSVFPLGAVLAVLPFALLGEAGLVKGFFGGSLAALIAGLCVYSFYQLAGVGPNSNSKPRRILLALFPIFGTWSWCNLGLGGSWQIALGFALLGQAGALYFTLHRRGPFLAGACFALAFGNRTELILTIPIYLYFWGPWSEAHLRSANRASKGLPRGWWKPLGWFLAIPAALALGTAAYNFARFDSIFDFGYARIANLTQEPWYRSGLFSFHAIPWNAFKMLFEGMQDIPTFPYLRPYPFGCSIFLSSPFLCLLFREGGDLKALAWSVIGLLTLVLWCHGNPGGWQFSYRYAMILLPWMFLLLLRNGPRKLSATELGLFLVSVAINAIAVYEFLWTNNIHP
ncbi:MAG TPA: hypothetical protein VNW28_03455 [Chthoniobacterales bacterium]|nr:hypothetical protein [Chthoniobacterales bacterium]